MSGAIGIGHTRWATHGAVTDANAHPHADASGRLVIVHNGMTDNVADLRAELLADGHVFSSETDTEVIAHLIGAHRDAGSSLTDAVGPPHAAAPGRCALRGGPSRPTSQTCWWADA